jgi:hypothetical protein
VPSASSVNVFRNLFQTYSLFEALYGDGAATTCPPSPRMSRPGRIETSFNVQNENARSRARGDAHVGTLEIMAEPLLNFHCVGSSAFEPDYPENTISIWSGCPTRFSSADKCRQERPKPKRNLTFLPLFSNLACD